MDELNNQNPNEPDNPQSQNNNPYQGADPFANANQDMYNQIQNNKEYANMYKLFVYKDKNEALEFNLYKASYGHVVHRYEMMRRSKLWKIAKKIRGKLK